MPMSERRKLKKDIKYIRQYYPGCDVSSFRRKKIIDPDKRLIKIRNVPDDDIIRLLGHRAAGSLYSSLHPPLDELIEKFDPIKELVEASDGAKMGDRMKFVQFIDGMIGPHAPWLRMRSYFNRFRGVDTVIDAGKVLLEMRERDVEAAVKPLIETEVFDTARTYLRSINPEGYSHRMDETELLFDVRRRCLLNFETGYIDYVKDMNAETLDKPITLGFPVDSVDARSINVMYRWDLNPYKGRTEILMLLSRIVQIKILGGFKPDLLNNY